MWRAISLSRLNLSGSPTGVVWGVPGKTVFLNRTVNDVTGLWEYNLISGAFRQTTFGAGPDLSPMPDPTGKGIYFVDASQSGALTEMRVILESWSMTRPCREIVQPSRWDG